MEKHISKINYLINTEGIQKYKTKILSTKNMNIQDLNNNLKDYHINTKVYYEKQKLKGNPRPLPTFKFDNDKNIGYIKFYHFLWTNDIFLLRDLEKIKILVDKKLKIWEEKQYNKLIIDLTDFKDGHYISLVESLGYLFGNISLYGLINKEPKNIFTQPIWQNIKNNKLIEYLEVFRGSKLSFQGKISILVSKSTASGGLVSASIFSDRDNVKIIGQKPSEKISVNKTFILDNTDLYLSLPTKLIINTKGNIIENIVPNIITNNFNESLKQSYKYLLN